MGSSGPDQAVSVEDVRGCFADLDQPSKPISTDEVAEALGEPRQPVRERLEELADRGELLTRRMGDSLRAWWTLESAASGDPETASKQFAAFVRAVKDYAIFMLEPDGTVASWNEGAKRIKGYTEEEIVGEHFSTFYTEEARAEGIPRRNLERAETEGRTEDEGWRLRADGSRFWANVTITAIRNDDGELRGFTKVTRDMTERREYEQQIESQAERLERQRDELEAELDDIFERIDDAFYALDDELRFEYVNDTAEAYLGRSAGEILGTRIQDAFDIDEDHPLIEKFEEALASQAPTSVERYSEALGMWEMVRIYPSESLNSPSDRERMAIHRYPIESPRNQFQPTRRRTSTAGFGCKGWPHRLSPNT